MGIGISVHGPHRTQAVRRHLCAPTPRQRATANKKTERPPVPEPHLNTFEASVAASRPHEKDDFWAGGGGHGTALPVRKR
jgi:hypothetical protein